MLKWPFSNFSYNLTVDLHSHLIPGVDDGCKTMGESLEVLSEYERMGITTVITTPHIYKDVYPNAENDLIIKYDEVVEQLRQNGIQIDLRLGAEYYCDDSFLHKIKQGIPLLKFGDNFVLVETSFLTKPMMFDQIIFELLSRGYKPILAHPERYQYLEGKLNWLESIIENGVLLQVNWGSLIGAYGKAPKKMAFTLLKKQMVAFLGSDLHRENQMEGFKKAIRVKFSNNKIINSQLA